MTGPSLESWFENWGPPSVKVKRARLLRYEKSISVTSAILISKVQPCPTSSGVHAPVCTGCHRQPSAGELLALWLLYEACFGPHLYRSGETTFWNEIRWWFFFLFFFLDSSLVTYQFLLNIPDIHVVSFPASHTPAFIVCSTVFFQVLQHPVARARIVPTNEITEFWLTQELQELGRMQYEG